MRHDRLKMTMRITVNSPDPGRGPKAQDERIRPGGNDVDPGLARLSQGEGNDGEILPVLRCAGRVPVRDIEFVIPADYGTIPGRKLLHHLS